MVWFIFFIAIMSAVCHEVAHGWLAERFGDPTARRAGRITLNPLAHIDPFWTILLPLLLVLMGSKYIFAMAKPVPVNFLMLTRPRQQMRWVALVGPGVNLALAMGFALVIRMGVPVSTPLGALLGWSLLINLVMGLFNLLPIPPLDGSRVVLSFLPSRWAWQYSRLEPYGIFIVMALFFSGVAGRVMYPILHVLVKAMLGT